MSSKTLYKQIISSLSEKQKRKQDFFFHSKTLNRQDEEREEGL